MQEEIIKRFIDNGCYEDTVKYGEYIKNRDRANETKNLDGQWSYLTELVIITIKSLIPSNEIIGTVIDYKRFEEELKLWHSYRHGYNKALLNALTRKSSNIYWNETDNSSYCRIFPLVASNSNWETTKDQILKNLVCVTGNINTILECLVLSKLLQEILDGITDYECILEDIKEEIIHFSQKDFIDKYSTDFLFILDTYEGNYAIDFERKRISLINILNGLYLGNDFQTLKQSLEILNHNLSLGEDDLRKEDSELESTNHYFLAGLRGALDTNHFVGNYKDKSFITNLGSYLYKLRKSRISPESLIVEDYFMPDVFSFNEGDTFNHTLLNTCKVVKKENYRSFLISYIKTKAGTYRFFRSLGNK
ncbi:MAG: hypothetical protein FH761_16815 [Firmicutes bacterium]|nr:hypothetical protein [Bacillota bacterium]